jgi:hypothetical protein
MAKADNKELLKLERLKFMNAEVRIRFTMHTDFIAIYIIKCMNCY